ncbi:MAG: AEC family transporter [Leucobacter sp.]|nr:AEC family transporter [Leucobacter sp.]
MLGVLQGFTLILGVIGAGYLAGVLGIVKGDQRLVLNNVAFYIATPALLFDVIHDSDPKVLLSPVILATSAAAILAAATYLVIARLRFRGDIGSLTLGATSSGYVNSNNLGLPVALYILGDAAYVAPLILVQVVIYAPIILAILEMTRGNRSGAGIALARAASNPIIIASLLGFLVALFGWELPAVVFGPIEMLGAAAVPMILMSFGVSLYGQRTLQPGTGRASVITSSIIKVFLMPLFAWVIARAIGLDAHSVFVATTIAALPTAQNVYNYAATYRRAEVMVRDTVFITTFASLPVIAIIALLLGG